MNNDSDSSSLVASTQSNTDNHEERRSLFSRLFTKKNNDISLSIRENLQEVLKNDFIDDKVFSKQERNILHNILKLRDQRIDDIMIPRVDIIAIDINESLANLLKIFSTSTHSRLPVYEESLDDPKGMIHIKDVLNYITEKSLVNSNCNDTSLDFKNINLDTPLSKLNLVRPVLFVPNFMPAANLINSMQTARIQMALVIDEHGGTDGLVSLEDVVELIVGDIEDEHDDVELLITPEGKNSWIADARIELPELQKFMGEDFIISNESMEDVDTLGGLIVQLIDRIPQTGETINFSSKFKFYIVKADSRRILQVKIYKLH